MCVCVCVCVCACVYTVYVFVGSCLANKVGIGNLPAMGRGWVIIKYRSMMNRGAFDHASHAPEYLLFVCVLACACMCTLCVCVCLCVCMYARVCDV